MTDTESHADETNDDAEEGEVLATYTMIQDGDALILVPATP